MVAAAFQVLGAVVIVIILMAVALWQFNTEVLVAIRNAGKIKKSVVVFDTIKDFAKDANLVYDLYNTSSKNYLNIGNSVNQESGIEYSYNFWMYVDQTALSGQSSSILGKMDANVVNVDSGLDNANFAVGKRDLLPIVLFQRGDPHVYTYKSACSTGYKTDAIVKNPIVKLENGGDMLSVEFNTLDHPDAHTMCPSATNGQQVWPAANQQKLSVQGLTSNAVLNANWFMVTIVVQQTDPTTALMNRDSSICTIYINGVNASGPTKIKGASANSPVRNANGNLYVNQPLYKSSNGIKTNYSLTLNDATGTLNTPATDKHEKLQMSNLTYFNYALGPADISDLYSAGYSSQPAAPAATSSGSGSSATMPSTTVGIAVGGAVGGIIVAGLAAAALVKAKQACTIPIPK
jgi:hypothetical protein